jgi:phage terminase small subunit
MSAKPYTKLKGTKSGTVRRVDPLVARELDVPPDTEAMLGLTPMQKAFAEIYVSRDDLTVGQMAVEAGYSSGAMGSALIRHGPVVSYIKKLQQELSKKYEVTFESHVRKLAQIRDIALQNGAYAAAVSAEKHRGQAAGLYIDRKEILHGRLDQMSKEDVMKEIAKLTEEFPGLSTILETSKVIEHQPSVAQQSGQNEQEARVEVQQEVNGSNQA